MTTDNTRIALLEQSRETDRNVLVEIKELLEKQGEQNAKDRKEFMEVQKKQDETILLLGVNDKEQEKKIDIMQSTFDKENTNNSIKYKEYDDKHKMYDGIMNRAIGWSVGFSVGGTGVAAAFAKMFGFIH